MLYKVLRERLGLDRMYRNVVNLLSPISCSYEAGELEQPELEPKADMWTMTVGKFGPVESVL